MSESINPERDIFLEALDCPDEVERTAYVDRACNGDDALRKRVDALLHSHNSAQGFLDAGNVRPLLQPDFEATSATPTEGPGSHIGRYKILEKIGEGGFGIVYMAEQEEPVRRNVALKVIKLGMDTREVVARFEAERQALAMMAHRGIASVFDGGATAGGRPFFVMELVRGIPITEFCNKHRLTVRRRLELFAEVCQAVQHAHQKGVIHRDIKPSNILVAGDAEEPLPKVIDFGIAKAIEHRLTDKTLFTRFQRVVGTPAYMSPEQMGSYNGDIDTRTDIYSLGVLLYQLLTGRTPLDAKTMLDAGYAQIERSIRESEPPRPSARIRTLTDDESVTVALERGTDPGRLRSRLRGDLDWIVMRCLEKDRTRRYDTVGALAADLRHYLNDEPVSARPPSTTYTIRKFVRRHRVAVAATTAIVGVVIVGSIVTTLLTLRALRAERLQSELRTRAERAALSEAAARRDADEQQRQSAKVRWARETALPEIKRLIRIDDIPAAFDLARKAEEAIRDDPALVELWPKIVSAATIDTSPSGAEVYAKPYRHPSAEWEFLGTTPLADVRLARAPYRYEIRKTGYETLHESDAGYFYDVAYTRHFTFRLVPVGSPEATPEGMVRVSGKSLDSSLTRLTSLDLPDYWIDLHEVTNREFKAFVDAGGYESQQYWQEPFDTGDGRSLPWNEAMARFRDTTGRSGPSNWTNGTYPAGEDDFPVTGVSWFEAAAYARFAGKRLPSIYHWRYAAPVKEIEHVIPFANFASRGPVAVGRNQSMDVHGTFDMAGNAKEWCWNGTDNGMHYLLGGGWREQPYMFGNLDAQPAFDRSDQNGFRCIKPVDGTPPDPRADAPRSVKWRDFSKEKPVGDREFESFRSIYAYDKTPLEAALESRDDSNRHWRSERIAFNAAYNGERMAAIVFLPRNSKPPYETIVFFPGSSGRYIRTSNVVTEMVMIEPWIENGRAVVYPIVKGSYERTLSGPYPAPRSIAARDWTVACYKDVARTIDYLETRDDIDTKRLAYVGWSWGGWIGTIISPLEPRLKVNVLIGAGFTNSESLPESEMINFAPHVTVPTLMVNGRYDFVFPHETAQRPLFDRLGTPPDQKRHVLFESGHIIPVNLTSAEISAWLDRYLGPVN